MTYCLNALSATRNKPSKLFFDKIKFEELLDVKFWVGMPYHYGKYDT
jgi:hypothetical protein